MSDVINAATDRIIAAIQARDEYIDLLLKKELRAAMWFARDTALEEAAKVSRPLSHMLGSADPYANGYRAACADIAAAIRGMIKGNDVQQA